MAKKMTGHNGFDADKVSAVVDEFEKIDAECETIMAEARSAVADKRAAQKDLIQDAKDAYSIPKMELKAVLATRKLERRAERKRSDLSNEAQETFDQIRFALGDLEDTPLGQAALGKTEAFGDFGEGATA